MDIANHNWNHVPKKWHDFIGSTAYGEEINLTRFFKALFDTPEKEKQDLFVKLFGSFHLGHTKNYSSVYKQVDHLLKHLLKVDGHYELLWDFVDKVQKESDLASVSELTLEEFYDRYGLKLFNDNTPDAIEEDIQEVEGLLEEARKKRWQKCKPRTDDDEETDDNGEEDEDDVDDEEDEEDYEGDFMAYYHYLGFFDDKEWMGALPKNLRIKHIADCIRNFFPKQILLPSGFALPQPISPMLQDFLRLPLDVRELARTEVTKRIIKYIQEHKLQDSENRRIIHPDSALKKIVGDDETRLQMMEKRKAHLEAIAEKTSKETDKTRAEKFKATSEFTFFNLQLFLNAHFKTDSENFRPGWKQVLHQIQNFSLYSLKTRIPYME